MEVGEHGDGHGPVFPPCSGDDRPQNRAGNAGLDRVGTRRQLGGGRGVHPAEHPLRGSQGRQASLDHLRDRRCGYLLRPPLRDPVVEQLHGNAGASRGGASRLDALLRSLSYQRQRPERQTEQLSDRSSDHVPATPFVLIELRAF